MEGVLPLTPCCPLCRCTREQCKFAHPEPSNLVDSQNKVTVCRESLSGKCVRPTCKFWHPPGEASCFLLPDSRFLLPATGFLFSTVYCFLLPTPAHFLLSAASWVLLRSVASYCFLFPVFYYLLLTAYCWPLTADY